jgi:hypothetical protein
VLPTLANFSTFDDMLQRIELSHSVEFLKMQLDIPNKSITLRACIRVKSEKTVILRPKLFQEKVFGFSFLRNQFVKETIKHQNS